MATAVMHPAADLQMLHWLRSRRSDPLRRWIVRLLLCALPLCGWAGTVGALAGSLHVHLRATGPMAGWQDARRAIGRVTAGLHAPARHHHAHDDASVFALDDGADDGGTAPAADAAPLALAAADGVMGVVVEPGGTRGWGTDAPDRVTSRPPDRLDRPPRG